MLCFLLSNQLYPASSEEYSLYHQIRYDLVQQVKEAIKHIVENKPAKLENCFWDCCSAAFHSCCPIEFLGFLVQANRLTVFISINLFYMCLIFFSKIRKGFPNFAARQWLLWHAVVNQATGLGKIEHICQSSNGQVYSCVLMIPRTTTTALSFRGSIIKNMLIILHMKEGNFNFQGIGITIFIVYCKTILTYFFLHHWEECMFWPPNLGQRQSKSNKISILHIMT